MLHAWQKGPESIPEQGAASLTTSPWPRRVWGCWVLPEAGEVLRFPAQPRRRHPQHPTAERANPARLILSLSSLQLIKASRHPAEDSLPVSLEGKAGP